MIFAGSAKETLTFVLKKKQMVQARMHAPYKVGQLEVKLICTETITEKCRKWVYDK